MTALIQIGDCRDVMRQYAAAGLRAQTCVTSPPYYGLRDVLADDGTLWLNIGDSYAGGGGGNYSKGTRNNSGQNITNVRNRPDWLALVGLKQKDLIGIPWMLAFALRADGWHLRQDIIWHKPNPMPESVRDRCTKAHEYVFLLSKSERYYYDQDAVLEPVSPNTHARLSQDAQNQIGSTRAHGGSKSNGGMKAVGRKFDPGAGNKNNASFDAAMAIMPTKRNRRSVWTVATRPYKGAHFATFPPALIEPCILAGSRPGDWVLDPFMGSGTTAEVAVRHGRMALGCELNPEYKNLIDERLAAI